MPAKTDRTLTPQHATALCMALLIALCVTLGTSGCADDSATVAPPPSPALPVLEESALQDDPRNAKTVDTVETAGEIAPPLQSTSVSETHEIPAALQNQITLRPEILPPPVHLELTAPRAEIFNQHLDLLGTYPHLQQSAKKKGEGKTFKIRGGVLLNPEAEELRERVDGAEVKFDLKWK